MAKVLNPFFTSDVSGRLGSLVFQRSRFSSLARVYYLPVNPRSVSQGLYRANHLASIAHTWSNFGPVTISRWNDFASTFFSSSSQISRRSLSGRTVFFRYALNSLLIGNQPYILPPHTPVCSYFPDLSVSYTVDGYSLSFSPEIPVKCGLVIRETRNLSACHNAPIRGNILYIFDSSFSSPQLISTACGTPSASGTGPAFYCGSFTHFHIRAIDSIGRSTEELFFNIQAST